MDPVRAKNLFVSTLEASQPRKCVTAKALPSPQETTDAVQGIARRSVKRGMAKARVPLNVTLNLLGVSKSCAAGPGVLINPDHSPLADHVAASRAALALYEDLLASGEDRLTLGRHDDEILDPRLPGGRYHIAPFTDAWVVLVYRSAKGSLKREVIGLQHVKRRLDQLRH